MRCRVCDLSIVLFLVTILFMACSGYQVLSAEQTAWRKFAKNPVLRADHKAKNNYDHYTISDCCVIKDGSEYKMWYTSSGFTPPDVENHCSISYAVSKDGITWEKYARNPVLNNSADAWDAYAVETVSVLIDADADALQRYKMWYAGRTKHYKDGGPAYDFGYATSPDGLTWTKYFRNPVLIKGTPVDWDNSFLEGPTVIKDEGLYKMWYAGFDAKSNNQVTDGKVCIGYAVSKDGINWIKYSGNPVLVTGPDGSWDSKTVQDPHVIKHNGIYHMWYGGANYDFKHYGQQTGFAYSRDGITWIKSADNPVLQRGSTGSWDANTAGFGSVLIDGDTVKMWYTGKDQDLPAKEPYFWDIGYAERTIKHGNVIE